MRLLAFKSASMALLFGAAGAFTSTGFARRVKASPSLSRTFATIFPEEKNGADAGDAPSVFRAFGIAATAAALALNVAYVPAAVATTSDNQENSALHSSSVWLSKSVQTMDFSLPSSYDSISEATASGVNELSVVENLNTGTKTKPKPSATSASKPGGKDMSLPSMGGNLTEEEKAKIAAERKAEREAVAAAEAAEAAERKAELEAEREAKAAAAARSAEEKAAEREATTKLKAEEAKARAVAKAEAAQQKAEKEEARAAASKLKGADFVDMGLPSYEDSASSTGEKKSMFAL